MPSDPRIRVDLTASSNLAPRFGAPGQTDPPLLDTLASYARTAIEDPHGLPNDEGPQAPDEFATVRQIATWRAEAQRYAIDKLDDIIDALNPAWQVPSTFRATLTMLGRHLAERQDEMEALRQCAAETDAPIEAAAYKTAIRHIGLTLAELDLAITALEVDALDADGHRRLARNYREAEDFAAADMHEREAVEIEENA